MVPRLDVAQTSCNSLTLDPQLVHIVVTWKMDVKNVSKLQWMFVSGDDLNSSPVIHGFPEVDTLHVSAALGFQYPDNQH